MECALLILSDVQCRLWIASFYCWCPPAAPGGTAIPGPLPNVVQAPEAGHGLKIGLINWTVYDRLSEIKLIRTDTTLDLSQKAEKV